MKKKLVVVVDMQNDFVTGVLGTKEAEQIVPTMVEFLQKWVKDGGDIVFTRDTHQPNYLETQEGKNLPVEHCIDGTNGWEIIDALYPIAVNSKIFNKPTFGSIELGQYVANNNYEEVVIVGVCTGICDISNALLIKAFAPEVPITVMSDLCACVQPETHKIALNAMQLCQINIAQYEVETI